jgi:hypothetical protein
MEFPGYFVLAVSAHWCVNIFRLPCKADAQQIGAAFSRAVAPTRTEKEMRRRLAEMKESEAGEGTP